MCAIRQRYEQCPGEGPLHRFAGDGASLPARNRRAGNVYPLRAYNC